MGIQLKNKGQIFLILAVITVVVLILLRLTVNLPDITQRERKLQGAFERKFFTNSIEELKKTVEISTNQPVNITTNVFDFANFTRNRMIERLSDFEMLYVSTWTQKTGSQMNVSVINLLNQHLTMTLTLNSSPALTQTNSSLFNMSRWDTNFSISPGTDYKITIRYNNTYGENVTMRTLNGQGFFTSYFDATLRGKEATYKNKFQKTYRLRV